jgi:hypothetical protein
VHDCFAGVFGELLKEISFKTKLILGGITAVVIPFMIAGIVIYIQLSRSLIEISKERAVHQAEDPHLAQVWTCSAFQPREQMQ